MLALSENIIIAQNAIESRWPWLLLVELRIKDDADTYRRWAQHGADVVTMLTTYGGSGCVAHWKLNDNDWSTVVTDASGNGNHGTAQRKTVHLHTNGITNGAFKQNGTTDYIDTGDPFQLTFRDSFSTSIWVKPDDGQPENERYMFSGGDGTGDVSWAHIALQTNGKIRFWYETEGVKGNNAVTDAVIFANGAASEWVHIVGVFDATIDGVGGKKIYINGVEEQLQAGGNNGSTAGVTPANFTAAKNAAIGANQLQVALTHFWIGGLDNAMIFNRALTQAEISALCNSGKGTELVPATFDAFNFTLNQILYKGGEVPKTTLRFSNVTQFLKADLAANDGLTGSEITLRMVHANMLYEDYSELDVTFDIIFPKITAASVEFVIGGPSPLRRRVPIEIYFADACRYVDGFKTDPRCGYAGGETTCSGLRRRCRELDNEIQFGGFPGLRPETMKLA